MSHDTSAEGVFVRGTILRFMSFDIHVKNLKTKPNGIYCYRRAVPEDIRDAFWESRQDPSNTKGKPRQGKEFSISLQTRDPKVAAKKAIELNKKFDAEFDRLRAGGDIPGKSAARMRAYGFDYGPLTSQKPPYNSTADGSAYDELMRDFQHEYMIHTNSEYDFEYKNLDAVDAHLVAVLHGEVANLLTLTDAQELMVLRYGSNHDKKLEILRAFQRFKSSLPTELICNILPFQVESVFADMKAEGKTHNTIKKYKICVKKGVEDLIISRGATLNNPFATARLLKTKNDVSKVRYTCKPSELAAIGKYVVENSVRDTVRVIGLLINTGARLSEVAGLELSNIHVNTTIPHMQVIPLDSRGLKNSNSERLVPLVGLSLDIAKLILETAQPHQKYAFPRWVEDGELKNGTASQSVNQVLKKLQPETTTHSFRHTLTTRFVNAGIARVDIEKVMGWSSERMVDHYGTPDLLKLVSGYLHALIEYEKTEESLYKTPVFA